MSKRTGKCVNFGLCNNADSKKLVNIDESTEFVCPECQSRLSEVWANDKETKKKSITAGIIVVIIAILAAYFWNMREKKEMPVTHKPQPASQAKALPKPPMEKNEINISLDQWIGWRSILMANGGLKTKSGSIFDQLGLKVNIKNIDDNDAKLNALINGNLDAMGSTINRYAFEFAKLQKAKIAAKMVIVTNTSTGGDGIIAKKEIQRIEDLVGKKIALARFTEAQIFLEFLLSQSSLSQEEIRSIRDHIVFTDDAGKAGEAFFAGKADAAATWQPFITQAQGSTDGHILVDTMTFNNFILDGIIFRDDFIRDKRDIVKKFIQGILMATNDLIVQPPKDMDVNYTYLVDSFPMCANLKKQEIEAMFKDATLSDFTDNLSYFDSANGLALKVFEQSSQIWTKLGEYADLSFSKIAFDESILKDLSSVFKSEEKQVVNITSTTRESVKQKMPIITQRLTINFKTGDATILPESYGQLHDFSNFAKMVENSVIQIEGNTDNKGNREANRLLSEKRARAVAAFLQYQGINPTRFIVLGNGQEKPIGSNNTDSGRAKNRRTDVMLKAL